MEHPGKSYRAKRGIFKNLNFGLNFLMAPESPIEFLGIMWYTHLDLRLGLGIFFAIFKEKNVWAAEAKIWGRLYLA